MKKILTLLFTLAMYNSHAQVNEVKKLYPFSQDGKKWGVCDESLKVIAEPIYDQEFNFFNNIGFSFVYLNRKIGAMNDKGKIIFACKYDKAETFSLNNEVVAKVSLNDKEGLVSLKTDKILLPLNYDKINYESYAADIVSVWQNRKSGFVNVKTGRPIGKIEYTYVQRGMNESSNVIVGKDYKKGLLNLKTGKLVLPLIYDKIDIDYNNNTQKDFYTAEKSGKVFEFDANGKVVKKSNTETGSFDVENSKQMVMEAPPSVVNSEYAKTKTLNFYKIRDKSWKVTIESRSNNSTEILETYTLNGYDSIYRKSDYYDARVLTPYTSNILYVIKDGKIGLIDLSNNIKIACAYETIKYSDNINAYLIKKDNLWGIVSDNNHKEIIKPFATKFEEYSSIRSLSITKVYLPKGQIGFVNFNTGKVYMPGFTL